MQKKLKKLTLDQARQKALRYCAYQERSHEEVKTKLFSLGLQSPVVDELLAYLITEGFLNEERFAKVFTGGKFRIKKWGRIKITKALEGKGLSKNCIRIGLAEIEEVDYHESLEKLLKSKISSLDEPNVFIARNKASKHAIQYGYEPELVWEKLRDLLPD
ncbi:MAG TPA: RecX family transcriptional regulator [Cyclobacteriaceae bacterium]|nr:RecX family transcriptional regulator [Cyclobacteriaceae bacterium]